MFVQISERKSYIYADKINKQIKIEIKEYWKALIMHNLWDRIITQNFMLATFT